MALDAAVDSPSSVLSSHHSADISDYTKMHKHNKKKSAILTVQCHLISVLEVTKLSYFIFLFQVLLLFSLTSATVTLHCRSYSTTEDLQQRHRNQE